MMTEKEKKILKTELYKYCSAFYSFHEALENFKYALEILKLIKKNNSGEVPNDCKDIKNESQDLMSKYSTFLSMGLIAYVRPFRNNNKLSENLIPIKYKKLSANLFKHRNNITAHHQYFDISSYIEDPDGHFGSHYVLIKRKNGSYVPHYRTIIPRSENLLNEMISLVQQVTQNTMTKFSKFFNRYSDVFDNLEGGKVYEILNLDDEDIFREADMGLRFDNNEEGKYIPIPKYIKKKI